MPSICFFLYFFWEVYSFREHKLIPSAGGGLCLSCWSFGFHIGTLHCRVTDVRRLPAESTPVGPSRPPSELLIDTWRQAANQSHDDAADLQLLNQLHAEGELKAPFVCL